MKNIKKIGIMVLIQASVLIGFLSISFLANSFPSQSFIAGGDYYQLLIPLKHLYSYFYLWFNQSGQGMFNTLLLSYPFYVLVSLLDLFKFSSGLMTSFYMFFFFYLSYLSFYLSFKYFYPVRINGFILEVDYCIP